MCYGKKNAARKKKEEKSPILNCDGKSNHNHNPILGWEIKNGN